LHSSVTAESHYYTDYIKLLYLGIDSKFNSWNLQPNSALHVENTTSLLLCMANEKIDVEVSGCPPEESMEFTFFNI
jgi:hypothetical protein